MLSLEALIIARIQAEVAGFTTVGNASKLAGLGDKGIGPLLPACIVMPGSGEPVSTQQDSLPLQEAQEWDIVIIVPHQHTTTADGETETVAGAFMNNVLKALYGWKAAAGQRKGFIYQGRKAPSYNLGYAEFPLTFFAHAIVGQS